MGDTAPTSDTARPGPPLGGRSDTARWPSDPGLPTPHGPGHDAGGRSDTAGPAGPPGAPTPAVGPAGPPTLSDPARRRPETPSAERPEKPRGLLIRKKVRGALDYSDYRPPIVPDARELLEHDPAFVKRVGPGTCAVLDGKAIAGHVEIGPDIWAAARLPEIVKRSAHLERENQRLEQSLEATRTAVLHAQVLLELGKAPEALGWLRQSNGDPNVAGARLLRERQVLLDVVAQLAARDGDATLHFDRLVQAVPDVAAREAQIRATLARAAPARTSALAPRPEAETEDECPACGIALAGNPTSCPSCGMAFAPG